MAVCSAVHHVHFSLYWWHSPFLLEAWVNSSIDIPVDHAIKLCAVHWVADMGCWVPDIYATKFGGDV